MSQMEDLFGDLRLPEPSTETSCKCFNILSGSITLPCLHSTEEVRPSGISKVSQIATMFQPPHHCHGRRGTREQPTVVRTESHVARFHSAKAMFEKMAEQKGIAGERRALKCGSGSVTRRSSGGSSNGPASSVPTERSPSPSSPRVVRKPASHHKKPAPPVPPQPHIATISFLSSTSAAPQSFYSANPSVLSAKAEGNILSPRIFSEASEDALKDRRRNTLPVKRPAADEVARSASDRNPPPPPPPSVKESISDAQVAHLDLDFKPYAKPPKPDASSGDRLLSSHQQNQQLIQRHKNWFQSYCRTKSPASGTADGNRKEVSDGSHPSGIHKAHIYKEVPADGPRSHSDRVSCRENPPIRRKSLDDLDARADEEPTESDWRDERAAILAGEANRAREDNTQNYGDVSTLPSYWCPPRQYPPQNQEKRPPFTDSSEIFKDGVHQRYVPSVPSSQTNTPQSQEDRIGSQDELSVSSTMSTDSIGSLGRELRKSHARRRAEEDAGSVRSMYEIGSGSLKRGSYEVDRERRLKEWERRRLERGHQLSDEIKVHNFRVADMRARKKVQEKHKDEVIWVKREETHAMKNESRRASWHENKDEMSIREERLKEERKRRDEEIERRRKEVLERLQRDERERRELEQIKRQKEEEYKRRQQEEESERRRREEVERQKREQIKAAEKRRIQEEEEYEEKLLQKKAEEKRIKEEEHERERKRKEAEEEMRRKQEEAYERLREEKLQKKAEEKRTKEVAQESERRRKEAEAEEEMRRKQEEAYESVMDEKLQQKKAEEKRMKEEAQESERRRKEAEAEQMRRKQEEAYERLREEKLQQKKVEEKRMREEEQENEIRRRTAEEEMRSNGYEEKLRQMEEEAKIGEEPDSEQGGKEAEELRRMVDEEREAQENETELEEEQENETELEEEQENEIELEEEQSLNKQEEEEADEGAKKERDRMEIEKTKRRIAELKMEREELQRQQLLRMRRMLNDEEAAVRSLSEEGDYEEKPLSQKSEEERDLPRSTREDQDLATHDFLDENRSCNIDYTFVDSSGTYENTDVEVTDIEITDIEVTDVYHSGSSSNASLYVDRGMTERLEETSASFEEGGFEETKKDEDEVYYDTTVTSAQYKIEFCASPFGASFGSTNLISRSTISSDFEPLPPPIPPHSVDPETLRAKEYGDPSSPGFQIRPRTDSLGQYVESDPETMTAEEEQKLLSHNIIRSRHWNGLLSDSEAKEIAELLSPAGSVEGNPNARLKPLPEIVVQSDGKIAPPEGDDEDDYAEPPSGVPVGEVTPEGFVARSQEVHFEDGIHFFEDGHFWIEVPGLPEEDEDDEIPDSVAVHKHTKIKFSPAPIQLFSTFSVTDYDRKNEEVDPVSASAEYELEKRVEKMDVFEVQIDKGDSGLGLSIIGMGVGADAGVEKLGIFVKTVTPGGATDRDGRIKVNDQIIEVDGNSLVGVTQVFAASVLKNTCGTVNFLIGREPDPENSEVALLIRQSLMADRERDERRRALGAHVFGASNGGVFDSFSSQSGGESPSEDTVRNNAPYYQEVEKELPYDDGGEEEFGSCPSSPPIRIISPLESEPYNNHTSPVAGESSINNKDGLNVVNQQLLQFQQRNKMYEDEINALRSKINSLEKEFSGRTGSTCRLQETSSQLQELENQLQSKKAEISSYQDLLEQSQGQYIILEKKYYKAKKIIKEYQNRERDFLHREEYHITQLEEKDALYNSLVKALKDRIIQLEGDLMKVQQEAGMPVNLRSPSAQAVESKEPPCKPVTLGTFDPDLSDTEGGDLPISESEKTCARTRKVPLKEDLDVAVPPHELLDVSFSRAKGELGTRGGLANRQLPSLKKAGSSSSAGSFDHSLEDGTDENISESLDMVPAKADDALFVTLDHEEEVNSQQSKLVQTSLNQVVHSTSSPTNGFDSPPPPYQPQSYRSFSANESNAHNAHPPPYHPPPAPLAKRPLVTSDTNTGKIELAYRHPPPIARVQPVNRVEIPPSDKPNSPPSPPQHPPGSPLQQSLAEQLKSLLAEREFASDNTAQIAVKKSPSSLMEDVRQAVRRADLSIGKKPLISGPIHLSSTAQIVSSGHQETSPRSPLDTPNYQQKVISDSANWYTTGVPQSDSAGVILLSHQRPVNSSLSTSTNEDANTSVDSTLEARLPLTDGESSFESQLSPMQAAYMKELSVLDWTKEQVGQWLMMQGLEAHVGKFLSAGISGPRLINIDTKDLRNLGLTTEDKTRIKRKVKELRQCLEKERKQLEREKKEREKLQKKAEKLAEKAERRKK